MSYKIYLNKKKLIILQVKIDLLTCHLRKNWHLSEKCFVYSPQYCCLTCTLPYFAVFLLFCRTSRQESLPVVTEKDSKPQQKINLRGRLADFQSLGSINLEKIRSTGAIYPHTNVLNKYMTQFVRQHGTVSFRKLQNVNI